MRLKFDMCNHRRCLRKHTCSKFTTIPAKGWQKKINFDRDKGALCYKHDYELNLSESK